MNIDLSNKVAFVTGGSKGIGAGIVEVLTECGANVGFMARTEKEAKDFEKEINARNGGRSFAIIGDVAKEADVQNAIEQTVLQFGQLDYGINNAGIAGEFNLLHETDTDNWKNVLAVNLDGVFYSMKYEIQEMLKNGAGAIVNIGSVEAHTILSRNPAYTTTKHGIIGLTKTAAADYADKGIRVNTVSPGVIDTPLVASAESTPGLVKIIPTKRMGTIREIGYTVAFLLSDYSAYTTGSEFLVEGAFLLAAGLSSNNAQ